MDSFGSAQQHEGETDTQGRLEARALGPKDSRAGLFTAAALDRQKPVAVCGTFLHNRRIMERFRREDYRA